MGAGHVVMTDPEGMIGYLARVGSPDAGWTERILQQVAQGKFLGLLTIMFGIGLAIQQASTPGPPEPEPEPEPDAPTGNRGKRPDQTPPAGPPGRP